MVNICLVAGLVFNKDHRSKSMYYSYCGHVELGTIFKRTGFSMFETQRDRTMVGADFEY